MADDQQTVAGVALPARTIPFPRSISAQARENLESLVDLQGRPRSAGMRTPAADDTEGWAAARTRVGEFMLAMMPPAALPVETVDIDGVVAHMAVPPGADDDPRVYLDIHGGGLVHGGGEACRRGASLAAQRYGVRCWSVDYRMPPAHPYPAPLDDCVAAYRGLLNQYEPKNIIVGGSSAGGNLAAALVLRARDEGLPLPAALVLQTPEVDLTESGDTFQTNRWLDVVLPEPLMDINLIYAAGHDLADPYLSPLFGDFTKGFPPTVLQSGTRDLFLSNTVRMHRALLKAGVAVELHVYEGMPHGGFMGAPEDAEMAGDMARFVAAHWGRKA